MTSSRASRASYGGIKLSPDPDQPFNRLIGPLYKKKWIAYCKEPFAGPQEVVDYIGRYTHRIAISNHRITGMTDDTVSFWRRDPNNPKKRKAKALSLLEFIRLLAGRQAASFNTSVPDSEHPE